MKKSVFAGVFFILTASSFCLDLWAAGTPPAPTDRNVPEFLLSPQVDLLILAGLAWWVWRMYRRKGEDELFYRADRPGRASASTPERPQELGRFRARWADQFKRIRYAELRRDLEPVRSLVSPAVFQQLEVDAHRVAEMRPATIRLTVTAAHIADRRPEEDGVRVIVRFVGKLRRAEETRDTPFEEFWTFASDPLAEEGWIVQEIHRGERKSATENLA